MAALAPADFVMWVLPGNDFCALAMCKWAAIALATIMLDFQHAKSRPFRR